MMNARRWRAVAVALVAIVAIILGGLAVVASARLASALLAVLVVALALFLYREIERAASLRARNASVEQLLAQTATNLERAQATDTMTQLSNRMRFFERLQSEFRRSERYGRPLACVLIDLDHFSWINEQYGEHFGDAVLMQFAGLLARDLRNSDLAVRYEGETFAILMPETPAEQAVAAAERMRAQLKDHIFSNGVAACSLRASFGIAGLPDPRITRLDDLVHRASQALAEAKRQGRDRVVLDAPPGREPEPSGPPSQQRPNGEAL